MRSASLVLPASSKSDAIRANQGLGAPIADPFADVSNEAICSIDDAI